MIPLLAHTFIWLYIYSLNNITFTFSKFTDQNRFINLTHLSTPDPFNDSIGFINAWFAMYMATYTLVLLYIVNSVLSCMHFSISFVVNNICDISRRCCDIYRQRIFLRHFPSTMRHIPAVGFTTFSADCDISRQQCDIFRRLWRFPAMRHFPALQFSLLLSDNFKYRALLMLMSFGPEHQCVFSIS